LNHYIVSWNFDKPSYSPGEDARINLWCENKGSRLLYVSKIAIEFDFGVYPLPQTVCGTIKPGYREFLGTAYLPLPLDVVCVKIFKLRYIIYLYDDLTKSWNEFPNQRTHEFFVCIFPKPLYNVFLSRGIRIEDRIIGDPIAEMIREWGFNTITVGIEVDAPDNRVAFQIRKEIQQNAHATIVVATPRTLDLVTEAWNAAEWIHGETGISYGLDKPILILKDRNVSLGGLPSYLAKSNPTIQLEFDPNDLHDLKGRLSTLMPSFRNAISHKNAQEFTENVRTLGLYGLAALGGVILISGIVGAISDSKE
jgi:hypothetical protein